MIELLTNSEMATADRLAVEGGARSIDLMERAGRAVAEMAMRRAPAGAAICVVAGPGNNGGDGYVAARLLTEAGFRVSVASFGSPAQLKGDAATVAQRWSGKVEDAGTVDFTRFDILVDGLFGAGLQRAVEGAAKALIERINTARKLTIAIDLPSGVNGTSGAVLGTAVTATDTVTFFRRKPGHLLLPGRLHCGRVSVADIGIPDRVLATIAPRTFVNTPALWGDHFPIPRVDGHKYQRGHVVTLSGGLASTGAARLAALAALRSGAGVSTIATPSEALMVHAAANLAVMVKAVDTTEDFAKLLNDGRINAVAVGPGTGIGAGTRDCVLAALSGNRAVVLDADALTSFVDDPERLFTALRERGESPAILTPHEGEFSRLFSGKEKNSSVKQKLEKAREASHETNAVIVLKGPDTVVASPGGRRAAPGSREESPGSGGARPGSREAIAENAPAWLATAGSGDVLTGMIAGLCAQGMPAFEAACAGVWLHGEAGHEIGPGLIADDLPGALPAIYRRLFNEIARMRDGT